MRLFSGLNAMWWLPTRCLECWTTTGPMAQVLGGTKIAHVCLDCAVQHGYHEVMPSIAEKVYARQTER